MWNLFLTQKSITNKEKYSQIFMQVVESFTNFLCFPRPSRRKCTCGWPCRRPRRSSSPRFECRTTWTRPPPGSRSGAACCISTPRSSPRSQKLSASRCSICRFVLFCLLFVCLWRNKLQFHAAIYKFRNFKVLKWVCRCTLFFKGVLMKSFKFEEIT